MESRNEKMGHSTSIDIVKKNYEVYLNHFRNRNWKPVSFDDFSKNYSTL